MNTITMKILELTITVVVLIVGAYIVPFIKTKIESEKFDNLRTFVCECVDGAEQLFGPKTGEQKKTYVTNLVKNFCDKIGFGLTEDQIEALIESAVHTANMINAQ